jgi:hypothetical protein
VSTAKQKFDQAVFARDDFRCAACLRQGEEYCIPHHRKNRQMGGSKKPLLNGFQNVLTLCAFCNDALETDASFAESGRQNGWKLESERLIAVTAVYFWWAREWRLLDAWGGYEVVDRRDVPQALEGMDL